MVFTARILRLITFLAEWIMSIPVIGFVLLLLTNYKVLIVLLILHVLSIFLSKRAGLNHAGNTIGVIASVIGFYPKIGILFHFLAALLLLFNQFSKQKRKSYYKEY